MEQNYKGQFKTSQDVLGKLHIESKGSFSRDDWRCIGTYGEAIAKDVSNLKKVLLVTPIPGYKNVYDYHEPTKDPFSVLKYSKLKLKNMTKDETMAILRENLNLKEERKVYILFPNLTDNLINILEIITEEDTKEELIDTLS